MRVYRGHVRLSGAEEKKYKVIRERMLDKKKYRCEKCGKGGRLEIHHIIPIWKGGSFWDEKNMMVLCRKCHIDHHRYDKSKSVTGRQEWLDYVTKTSN